MPCGSRVVFNCCSILMSMPAAQGQEGRPHRGMPERQTNREGARSCRHLPDSRQYASVKRRDHGPTAGAVGIGITETGRAGLGRPRSGRRRARVRSCASATLAPRRLPSSVESRKAREAAKDDSSRCPQMHSSRVSLSESRGHLPLSVSGLVHFPQAPGASLIISLVGAGRGARSSRARHWLPRLHASPARIHGAVARSTRPVRPSGPPYWPPPRRSQRGAVAPSGLNYSPLHFPLLCAPIEAEEEPTGGFCGGYLNRNRIEIGSARGLPAPSTRSSARCARDSLPSSTGTMRGSRTTSGSAVRRSSTMPVGWPPQAAWIRSGRALRTGILIDFHQARQRAPGSMARGSSHSVRRRLLELRAAVGVGRHVATPLRRRIVPRRSRRSGLEGAAFPQPHPVMAARGTDEAVRPAHFQLRRRRRSSGNMCLEGGREACRRTWRLASRV